MANITVKKIVETYLRANGYGGLVGEDGCGCFVNNLFTQVRIDNDWLPCCEDASDCEAAYEWPCTLEGCPNPDGTVYCDGLYNSVPGDICLRREKPRKDGAK